MFYLVIKVRKSLCCSKGLYEMKNQKQVSVSSFVNYAVVMADDLAKLRAVIVLIVKGHPRGMNNSKCFCCSVTKMQEMHQCEPIVF